MKKIVLCTGPIYVPDKNAAAQRTIVLCNLLRDLGYTPVILGMDETQRNNENITLTKRDVEGIETYTIPKPVGLGQWIGAFFSIKYQKQLIEYLGKENIFSVIAVEHKAIALSRLAKYCSKQKINLAVDVHEWYGKSNLKFPLNLIKDFDTNYRMKKVYVKKTSNMICISSFLYDYYSGKVKNRVFLPVVTDKKQSKWETLPKYIPNENFTIGYAGDPGENFNKERLDLLVKAVMDLNAEGKKCVLKIAGIDKETFEKRAGFEPSNEIVFLGRIEHIDCLGLIATCDFSAIIRENNRVTLAGFPTKLGESFACGTPVISTDTSNVKDFIENGKNGFLCKDCSFQEIRTAICSAIEIEKTMLKEMHNRIFDKSPLDSQNFLADLSNFVTTIKESEC